MPTTAGPRSDAEPLLALKNLSVSFPGRGRPLAAVRGLNLQMAAGSITCLVGESGCGKSLTAKAVIGLAPANAMVGGEVFFKGRNLIGLPLRELNSVRGRHIGMIFQEPMTSLNPVLSIGDQTAEPLRVHLKYARRTALAEAERLLGAVGIPDPGARLGDYPHQLSGGMRQRVMIAMAMACRPELLLADEPTTALDVTIQGQILRLLHRESRERGMAVLLITHNLDVVAQMADEVGVMYAGMLVESCPVGEFFANPLHPYTRGLMAAAPSLASRGLHRLPTIPGAVPQLAEMPPGCPFAPRCTEAGCICRREVPPALDFGGHMAACWQAPRAAPTFARFHLEKPLEQFQNETALPTA